MTSSPSTTADRLEPSTEQDPTMTAAAETSADWITEVRDNYLRELRDLGELAMLPSDEVSQYFRSCILACRCLMGSTRKHLDHNLVCNIPNAVIYQQVAQSILPQVRELFKERVSIREGMLADGILPASASQDTVFRLVEKLVSITERPVNALLTKSSADPTRRQLRDIYNTAEALLGKLQALAVTHASEVEVLLCNLGIAMRRLAAIK